MLLTFEITEIRPLKDIVRALEEFLPECLSRLEVFPFIQDVFLVISSHKYHNLVFIYKKISDEYCVFAIPKVELYFLVQVTAMPYRDFLVL